MAFQDYPDDIAIASALSITMNFGRGSEIIWSPLTRINHPVVGILNECWKTEALNLDIELGGPFRPIYRLTLYCAGGASGPDPGTFTAAATHIKRLGPVISTLYRKFHDANPDFEESVKSIHVPYQYVGIYYLEFLSEYGGGPTFAVKTGDCGLGKFGIYQMGESKSIVGVVSAHVQSVLNAIFNSLPKEEVQSLKQWMTTEKVMGPEIVDDLLKIIERSPERFEDAERMIELLIESNRLLKNPG